VQISSRMLSGTQNRRTQPAKAGNVLWIVDGPSLGQALNAGGTRRFLGPKWGIL
jgi:hypothetical protein